MLTKTILTAAAALLSQTSSVSAFMGGNLKKPIVKRQIPASGNGATTIVTPNNYTVSYKDTGKAGICETTPGVGSYSGYVDLAPDVHVFFWFFESRRDPKNDPITLWLNGGPGSDSLIGLFEELGPCNVSEDIKAHLNPYSFNEISNLLFISQPVGVGFSYGEKALGSLNEVTGSFQDASHGPVTGRYPVIDAVKVDTTELAAKAVWEVLQGFLGALPTMDSKVGLKEFNLFTESYGGHYGPTFYNYFYDQNQAIQNGSTNGTQLNFNSLGIINGIIDEVTQAPYYPEFARYNSYGIEAINETVYDYMKFALNMPNGCLAQVAGCRAARDTGLLNQATDSLCQEAEDMCRDNVEGPYYSFGGRGVYDIRHPYNDPTPPSFYEKYVMLPEVQQALGVDLNYTTSNNDIYFAFQSTGDFIFDNFIKDLEHLLNEGVRVSLIYGDADYICNWFGGQAVSLAVNYTHKAEFAQAGYAPFTVDGTEYGEVRQYGNFSFARVYEAGHEVPYYQPLASLELFNRTINHFDIATGEQNVTASYQSKGNATATHTAPFVPLPASTGSTSTAVPLIRGPIIPRKAEMRFEA